jgi:hypothetical protein
MIGKDNLTFAENIYIKPEEAQLFWVAWENLMLDFKIPEQYQVSLFEVMENFFLRLDHHSIYTYEINCAIGAIDFFINYTKKFNASVSDKGPIEIDEFAKVRFEIAGIETEFVYPNSSKTTVNALYNYLRQYDNFLRSYLHRFDTLPLIDDLHLIKEQLGEKRDDSMQFYVIEQIEDLKSFISAHISKALSKRTNHFIFELLYLFNIIKYAGKVKKKDCKVLELSESDSTTKFNPLIKDTKYKTQIITAIVSHATKKVKYHA